VCWAWWFVRKRFLKFRDGVSASPVYQYAVAMSVRTPVLAAEPSGRAGNSQWPWETAGIVVDIADAFEKSSVVGSALSFSIRGAAWVSAIFALSRGWGLGAGWHCPLPVRTQPESQRRRLPDLAIHE